MDRAAVALATIAGQALAHRQAAARARASLARTGSRTGGSAFALANEPDRLAVGRGLFAVRLAVLTVARASGEPGGESAGPGYPWAGPAAACSSAAS